MNEAIMPICWMHLSSDLHNRARLVHDSICRFIEKEAGEMLPVLMHDVDFYDPKTFYERELPYRIETAVRKDHERISEAIDRSYGEITSWLNKQLKGIGVQSYAHLSGEHFPGDYEHTQSSMQLMDSHGVKIKARVATLVACLALSGFGMGAFVASMVGGTLAEEVMLSRAKYSRDKIKEVLPHITGNYAIQMKAIFIKELAALEHSLDETINTARYEYCNS